MKKDFLAPLLIIIKLVEFLVMSDDATTALNSSHGSGHSAHMMFNEGIIIIFVMLIIYMAFEAFKHKKDLSFGHEASLVTLIGFGISYAY